MIREINTHDMDDVIILLNELNTADIVDKKLLAIHLENLKKNSNIKIYGYEHENRIAGMVTLGKVEGISMNCRQAVREYNFSNISSGYTFIK